MTIKCPIAKWVQQHITIGCPNNQIIGPITCPITHKVVCEIYFNPKAVTNIPSTTTECPIAKCVQRHTTFGCPNNQIIGLTCPITHKVVCEIYFVSRFRTNYLATTMTIKCPIAKWVQQPFTIGCPNNQIISPITCPITHKVVCEIYFNPKAVTNFLATTMTIKCPIAKWIQQHITIGCPNNQIICPITGPITHKVVCEITFFHHN